MKVGVVVPYSYSFWGGVLEHAEEQALALTELGLDARILIGNDPPGRLSRLLHPTAGDSRLRLLTCFRSGGR